MRSLYKECVALGLEQESEDAVYVFAESVLYLVGATGAFEFQRHVKPLCKARSAKIFRLRLRAHVYSNLSIKLYALHLALKPNITQHRAKQCAQACDISLRDAKLMWLLFSQNHWFHNVLTKYARSLKCDHRLLEQSEIQGTFNRVFPSVLKYIKHITYTKLRFLVKSTNSDFSDFHSELSTKLVQSFYSMVPITLSDAHLVNYLKRVVHNHAVNMIKSGTTQKRGRLVSSEVDENGNRQFSMLCLSQNQMPLTEAGELADVEGADDSAKRFELCFSITEILNSLKEQSKNYRFLSLLLGSEDLEFSDWLRRKGTCRESEDNVDVQHRYAPTEYTNLVSQFLHVSKQHADEFLHSLKMQLA